MSHPSLQVSSGRPTLVEILKNPYRGVVKKNTKDMKTGSGHLLKKTAKQGLERKVDFEQAKLIEKVKKKSEFF
jgi:hypothetical protein